MKGKGQKAVLEVSGSHTSNDEHSDLLGFYTVSLV
jgi:hypothetical protein